jgi:hypothetical protein
MILKERKYQMIHINKNYLYVIGMTSLIGISLFIYKGCTFELPEIPSPATFLGNTVKPVPKKPVPSTTNTTTTQTTKPDGTVTTTVVEKVIVAPQRGYKLGVGIIAPSFKWEERKYEATFSKRILEHTWLGVGATSDGAVKLQVEVEL